MRKGAAVAWPNTIAERNLDEGLRVLAAVALVLYLLPAVKRLNISPRIASLLRWLSMALVAAGALVAGALTLLWFTAR